MVGRYPVTRFWPWLENEMCQEPRDIELLAADPDRNSFRELGIFSHRLQSLTMFLCSHGYGVVRYRSRQTKHTLSTRAHWITRCNPWQWHEVSEYLLHYLVHTLEMWGVLVSAPECLNDLSVFCYPLQPLIFRVSEGHKGSELPAADPDSSMRCQSIWSIQG